MAEYSGGKILLWSWVSRGLLDTEFVANLYYDGDVQKANEALSGVKGKLAQLCALDELPLVDGAPDPEKNSQPTVMEGEVCSFWCISNPESESESEPLPLPMWMRPSIDKAVLQWRDTASKWQQKLNKRKIEGKDCLPPKAQQKYDQFFATTTRCIVFDKIKQAEVVNVAAKSVAKLKRTCLLLCIHMSEDASKLSVTTGCGKLWSLKLLQHSSPVADVVPEVIDHFEGLGVITVLYCTVLSSTVQ